MIIRENISLKAFNTFGIDVKAKKFVEVADLNDLRSLINLDVFVKNDFFVLGGGSNVLFKDDYEGLIVKNNIGGIEVEETAGEDEVIVTTGAGVVWNDLVLFCIDRNYGVIENLSLIPGSVGAGPIQNIGAYGVELKDSFHSLQAIDIETGELRTFLKEECQFAYRNSIFKKKLKGKVIIISVSLKLRKAEVPDTSYGAIRDELADMGITGQADIRSVGVAVSSMREKKLPDPEVNGNAGSFFKNPVIPLVTFKNLKQYYPDIPSYEADPGFLKVPAGWLIEQCGWKGRRVGNAGVHDKQALVIVNYGDAIGSEILELAEAVKASVKDKFGIDLEMEVNVL